MRTRAGKATSLLALTLILVVLSAIDELDGRIRDEAAGTAVVVAIGTAGLLTLGSFSNAFHWQRWKKATGARRMSIIIAAHASALLFLVGGSPSAALAEELISRGLPTTLLEKHRARSLAFLVVGAISATSFTVLHGFDGVAATANRLIFGIALFALAVRAANIYWPFIFHALSNTLWHLGLAFGREVAWIYGADALLVVGIAVMCFRTSTIDSKHGGGGSEEWALGRPALEIVRPEQRGPRSFVRGASREDHRLPRTERRR